MLLEDVNSNDPANHPLVDSAWRSLRWLKLWVVCVWLASLCRLYHPLHDEEQTLFDAWAVLNFVGTFALFMPIATRDRHITRLFKIRNRTNGLHFLLPFAVLTGLQSVLDVLAHRPSFLSSDMISIQLFAASVVVQLIAALCAQSAYARQHEAIAGSQSDIESQHEGSFREQLELVSMLSAHIITVAIPPLYPALQSPREAPDVELW